MPSLQEEIVLSLFQTIGALADAVSAQDTYAPGHRLQASQIARSLAQIIGFEGEDVDAIRMAAMLHDIGMMYVPREILIKPGPLTDEEFATVKNHVGWGAQMLSGIAFPWPVTQIIMQHHERLDGSGYPAGLSGGQITIEAQVLAAADVMEAMTAPRPWRPAIPAPQALAELVRDRAAKFDASVVDACIELYTNQAYRLDPEYYGRS
jgi:putative nucleotidyltransferase with HDIG domain